MLRVCLVGVQNQLCLTFFAMVKTLVISSDGCQIFGCPYHLANSSLFFLPTFAKQWASKTKFFVG
jgi:hypothetical protein